jgi:hypothetical protein
MHRFASGPPGRSVKYPETDAGAPLVRCVLGVRVAWSDDRSGFLG